MCMSVCVCGQQDIAIYETQVQIYIVMYTFDIIYLKLFCYETLLLSQGLLSTMYICRHLSTLSDHQLIRKPLYHTTKPPQNWELPITILCRYPSLTVLVCFEMLRTDVTLKLLVSLINEL